MKNYYIPLWFPVFETCVQHTGGLYELPTAKTTCLAASLYYNVPRQECNGYSTRLANSCWRVFPRR